MSNGGKTYFTGAQVQDSFCYPPCLLHKDSTGRLLISVEWGGSWVLHRWPREAGALEPNRLCLHQDSCFLQAGQSPLRVTGLPQDLTIPCLPRGQEEGLLLPVAAVGAALASTSAPQGSSTLNKGNLLYTHFRGNVLRWSQSQMGTELMKGMIVTRKYLQICLGIFVYVYMHTF